MTQNDALGTDTIIINKSKSVKTNKKVVCKICKIYKIYNDSDYVFISTRQENCNKYLYNVKHRTNKKQTKLLSILNTNYNVEFVEKFQYIDKNELLEKINLINNSACGRGARGEAPLINTNYKTANNKELDLKYGLSAEQKVLIQIQNYFSNDDIVQSKNQFSVFDYMGLKSNYLYELKSNRDKFLDYPNAILGINKIIPHQKQIFLFQFETDTNDKDLYYFIKPLDFEILYNKRQIFLKYRNIYNWVYDIPRDQLIKIIKNETCKLDLVHTNTTLCNLFYNLEKVRADTE